jgi:hypothetical protein
MKLLFITLLALSFIGVGVFGVFAMNHGFDQTHKDCIAVVSQGIECPKQDGILSLVAFHFDSFRSFSFAIFGGNFMSALLLAALMLTIASGIITKISFAPPATIKSYQRRQISDSYFFSFRQKLVYWLTLHENSPATL